MRSDIPSPEPRALTDTPPGRAGLQGNLPAGAGAESTRPPARRFTWRLLVEQREIVPLVITVLLFIFFSIGWSAFHTSLSINSAAGYAGPVGAIAAGEVLLLVLAEIDLSAGQIFLFTPWVMYWMWTDHIPVAISIVIAMLVAAGIGAINGLVTVGLNVPSFVTTLAMNFILYGAVLIFSDDTEATPIPGALPPQTTSVAPHVGFFGQAFGVWEWSEIVWVIALAIVIHLILKRTRFGTRIIATGGNLLGAAEAGVPVNRVKVWCFVFSASVAGFVGIIDAIKYGSMDPGNFGVDYILYAVGACVIGGTALTGGRGTVIGALIGAVLIGVLEDGLTIVGISSNAFYVFIGLVIIAAMALNVQLDRFVARSKTS